MIRSRKNIHARAEILFHTKRQKVRKINPAIYRLMMFTSVTTARAARSGNYALNLNTAE